MKLHLWLACIVTVQSLVATSPGYAQAPAPEIGRATDSDEIVLERLYPQARRFELELGYGTVLNPTFVNTAVVTATARFHLSEAWGVDFGYSLALTNDRAERRCVESFYNDPKHQGQAVCASQDGGAAAQQNKSINVGPAYVPIRELQSLLTLAADYHLGYGKQIVLYGATNHFDLRLRVGGGAMTARVYDERTTIRGQPTRISRGDPQPGDGSQPAGISTSETDAGGQLYGTDGRPAPRQTVSPVLLLGIAEDFNFARRFFFGAELTSYLTPGLVSGVDTLFVANLSLGLRI